MSLQLSDKISGIVEQTERLLDLKQGSYFSRNMGKYLQLQAVMHFVILLKAIHFNVQLTQRH